MPIDKRGFGAVAFRLFGGIGFNLMAAGFAPYDLPNTRAAELPSVAGGPTSDFTRGVFGLRLLAAPRTPSAAAAARAPAPAGSFRGSPSRFESAARAESGRYRLSAVTASRVRRFRGRIGQRVMTLR
jgi:hypothetical protein